jgi:hypothetical protein
MVSDTPKNHHFKPFSNHASLKIETKIQTNVSPFASNLWHNGSINHPNQVFVGTGLALSVFQKSA